MAFLNFIDVSKYQGDIDFQAVKAANVAGVIIKISGGDDGLYYDSKATANYNGAKAADMLVGGYHFAGHTDPIAEADFFVNGMKPFADNDGFVLDFDSDQPDAVSWVLAFVNRVHDLTGVWCFVYVNGSTRNAHDWSPVAANCEFWIAWYGKDPNADLPVNGVYVMHQYTSTAQIPGISGNVDEDAVFLTPEQFDACGWHPVPAAVPPVTVLPPPAPVPEPTPAPAPGPPVVTPEPVVDTATPSDTVVTPVTPAPVPEPASPSGLAALLLAILDFLKKFWNYNLKG